MRFLITIKSKYAICHKSKILFNNIETYAGRKRKYFGSDDTGEYQLLVPNVDRKRIIWERSPCYTEDQDGVAESSIRTIIEKRSQYAYLSRFTCKTMAKSTIRRMLHYE